jgi:hypothetical protein
VMLAGGRVACQGSHAAMMASNESYREFVVRQSGPGLAAEPRALASARGFS